MNSMLGREARIAVYVLLTLMGSTQHVYPVEQVTSLVAHVAGIKHLITVLVQADPGPRESMYQTQDRATVRVVVRISDHARETQFYGDVPVRLADFPLAEGSSEQKVWADSVCHQPRGIPKFAVVAMDGVIEDGKRRIPIEARPRHIGLLVPPDEISAARRLVSSADYIGQFTVLRAETIHSHLLADLKLYTLNCELAG